MASGNHFGAAGIEGVWPPGLLAKRPRGMEVSSGRPGPFQLFPRDRMTTQAHVPSTVPDSAAFEALLAPVLASAYGTALRMTRSAADAEDLLQEASLLAFRGFRTFESGSNFKAWFFRILTNCFYTTHRRARRRIVTVDIEDTPDLYMYGHSIREGLNYQGEDPTAQFFDRLDSDEVGMAIDALPEEYGIVASLYFTQDFSYQEIAEVLDCPVGTVRSRLHRGRKMLQKALWHLAEERGIIKELAVEDAE